MPALLQFRPIEFDLHQDLCIQFRADSFLCSFGSAERFYQPDGKGAEAYLEWLRRRLKQMPDSCVHAWQGQQVVGQVELGRSKYDAGVGYVYLFYLRQAVRGQGLAQQLDQYAADFFAQLGCKRARLSASPTNERAMRFYQKQGWVDVGQREDMPEVHYLEKTYQEE